MKTHGDRSAPISRATIEARPPALATDALWAIVTAVEAATGEDFFHTLVQQLATALGVAYAFASEITADGNSFRSVAAWGRGAPIPNFEVPLRGTPCEAVLQGQISHYADNVQTCFPEDRGIVSWGVVSYAGVPVIDLHGKVLGHLAVFDDRPLTEAEPILAVMRIFAARVRAELERLRVEHGVRSREARLTAVIGSALDAIIVFDDAGDIAMLNTTAERTLRCNAADVVGTSVLRFTTPKSRESLGQTLKALREGRRTDGYAEPGLVGRRGDGEEFEFEATLSRAEVDGEPLYTIILRDLTERRRLEEQQRDLRLQSEYLQEEIRAAHNFEEMVGKSPSLLAVLRQLELVATTDSTVLISGETGTGKELVARAIHARSGRAERPLVKVNCAALPAGLIESELFGHHKGAFTGATARRIGRFQLAHRGTIFLDEIGELSADVQVKLLRVLQERELEPVGGSESIKVDVRVIAATNRDLATMVREGTFREDLFYRLNVFPVQLPPLRARREDIPLLVAYFVQRYATRIGKRLAGVADATMRRLVDYAWPGNVRELENVIERAVILSSGSQLEIGPDTLSNALSPAAAQRRVETPSLAPISPADDHSTVALEAVERRHILDVLERTGWKIEGARGAAALLNLRPSTLRSRLQRLGIQRRR